MGSRFDYSVRVLMCGNCGAPLETGFSGGRVRCDYCGTVTEILPRKEDPVEPGSQISEMDEETRLELLRKQDGIQPELPQPLKPLLSGGSLAPWKVSEAMAMWRHTCSDLVSSNDYSSAELLYWLTIILSNHYSGSEDELRERALYESALEVLTLPRHRQLIRGLLCRNAALAGDIEAAGKWLAPCNPRSEDLESDSSYRVSKADIMTVMGDWQGVLGILGRNIDSVPITAALDCKAIVQRVNALEKTGFAEEATEQLRIFMKANGSDGLNAVRKILSIYADAGHELCSESMKRAEEMFSVDAGRTASQMQNPGGCFGQIFAITGVFLIILGAVLALILKSKNFEATLPAFLIIGGVGLSFLIIGLRHIAAGRRTLRLHREGVEASGSLTGIEPTGWKINGVPQYSLEIRVEIKGRSPYAAVTKKTIPDTERNSFTMGSILNLKVDPEDPQHISVVD